MTPEIGKFYKTRDGRKMTRILAALLLFSGPALAAEPIGSVVLPVTVTIVQCGPKDKILEACAKDIRCCVFVREDLE